MVASSSVAAWHRGPAHSAMYREETIWRKVPCARKMAKTTVSIRNAIRSLLTGPCVWGLSRLLRKIGSMMAYDISDHKKTFNRKETALARPLYGRRNFDKEHILSVTAAKPLPSQNQDMKTAQPMASHSATSSTVLCTENARNAMMRKVKNGKPLRMVIARNLTRGGCLEHVSKNWSKGKGFLLILGFRKVVEKLDDSFVNCGCSSSSFSVFRYSNPLVIVSELFWQYRAVCQVSYTTETYMLKQLTIWVSEERTSVWWEISKLKLQI